MFKITQIAIIGLVVILFIFRDGGTTPLSHQALPDPTSPIYKNIVKMRANLGLDTSEETLNRLFAEQGSNPGFAMAEDRAALQTHSDIESQINSLTAGLSPESFAGVYFKSAESKVVIKLVNSIPELKEQITAKAKFPYSIEFEEAQFTKSELDNAQKLIEANLNNISDVTSVGVDILSNRLGIGYNISEQQSLESRKQIEKLLNPQLIVYSFDLEPITLVSVR
jgi:hypothetical protein